MPEKEIQLNKGISHTYIKSSVAAEIAHSHPGLEPTLPDFRAASPDDNQFEYLSEIH